MAKTSAFPAVAFALTVLAGLLVGAGSALAFMKHGAAEVQRGWSGSRVTGSVDADPWTRAQVALTGLLALNASQAMYFRRSADDAGQPLRESCRYRVAGGPLPGRWWSVTVYAADDYLPRNDDGALSFDATRVQPDGSGHWQAEVSRSRPAGPIPWASSRLAGHFDLTLRLYNPAPSAQRDLASIPLPSVTRIDCAGGEGA
ncbi:DUF1214 domain-containing protein [Novosphingobium sp. FKTRR1]|uniref:DUF1214 domain-containing protein n=1 Tax=Novosphingobium sp. FKTRR1 TaxID=2879118 RepID=UPI001CF09677|nr:DUF1214 domain-containing protein [Novosphingobium sp. FKTRR1]